MSNKIIRANIQSYSVLDFDEYGNPNPIYTLSVNGKKLQLKTRGRKLPSGVHFSSQYEFFLEVTPQDEIVAFYSPAQHVKWGNQSKIRTIAGSKKKKDTYSFVSGTVMSKSSQSEMVNMHLPQVGTNSTMEKRTTYYIRIDDRTVQGSSTFSKVKVGDTVDGLVNQHGTLEMLQDRNTGKSWGLPSLWPMLIAITATIIMNYYFVQSGASEVPNQSDSEPTYTSYEKLVFFNIAAIPICFFMIQWSWKRFKILRIFHQYKKSIIQ